MNSTKIYLDNAATTPMDAEVVETMLPYMTTHFGNPSSTYSLGVETKVAIEQARKSIGRILGASPVSLYFTSGGTESNNTAIKCAVRDLGCRHIISSKIEHHATLHTVGYLESKEGVKLSYVELLEDGHVDMINLEELLASSTEKTLVSLMHANNEIGNLLDIQRVGDLCRKYKALFHSDMVQTIGHYPMNLQELPVDFVSAAGHKFHGPKGTGLLYINKDTKIDSFIHGGSQERGMRAGTENVYGIVGFAKALELATLRHEEDKTMMLELKTSLKERLLEALPDVRFNGDTGERSLYTVLNVSFPATTWTENLLFELDMNGICVSGGSACSSGSGGSHVIRAINKHHARRTPVRFSFSRINSTKDIDALMGVLNKIMNPLVCQ